MSERVESSGRRAMFFGAFKLAAGVAVLAGALHLLEVRRQGPLPPIYNIVFLAVGFLGFFAGLYASFADFKRWMHRRRAAKAPIPHSFSHVLDDELELSVLEPSDADAFFELVENNYSYLSRWLMPEGLVETREDTVRQLQTLQEIRRHGVLVPVGVWKAGELVGVVGLGRIDQERRSAELYYWIGEAHQGEGIVTRSCAAMLDYAFEELRLRRLVIRCEPRNERSCAVAERLGFVLEGTLRQCERRGKELVDLRIYGMLQGEWGPLG